MRRDFGGANARENKWSQDKADQPRHSRQQTFMENGDLNNPDFEEYYRAQDIVPEGEWEQFVEVLRKPLPITFRINGSGRYANELRENLESDFFANFSKGPIVLDGEVVDPPKPLPWYPNKLAWHMNFSRGQLRKLSWLAEIHEFMKAANEAGSITRQEAVSMVPPLFMDVQPHHKVLDMCAAPGSKTFQLLEMLHDLDGSAIGSGASAGSSQLTPTGFVVANDADAQRCNLLTHQTKRMCSPCLMVTNHEAQAFPRIRASLMDKAAPGSAAAAAAALEAAVAKPDDAAAAAGGSSGSANNPVLGRVGREDTMLFDRILADVPCSGDGTMRKAPDIWRRWTVNNGNGLHNLQLRIALQAARLLKVGGRMVYSTCTFNPIEDEAVVAELLVRCGGALELLDVSQQLPELKRLPGKRKWRVRDKFKFYDTWEEAEKVGFKLDPTMFSNAEKQQLPMERCMRILPHQQDTGGFFIAVLQKVAPTPPLEDPKMGHRFATYVETAGKPGRIVKLDGQDPIQGAANAAEAALQAAESAIQALESGDTAAVAAAVATASAAHARSNMAMEANSKGHKLSQQYDQQQPKRSKQEQQAEAADDGQAPAEAEEAAVTAADDAGAAEGADADAAGAAEGDAGAPAAAEAAAAGDAGAEAGAPKEAAAAAGEAAAGNGQLAYKPSWARGGGGRGRSGQGQGALQGGRFRGIDPIYPVEDPKILKMLVEFYGVEPGFPLTTHLITRSMETAFPKRLYFVSDALLSLLLADEREALKITSTGLKLFERQEMKGKQTSTCMYRIAQEGLPFLLPHLTKQRVRLSVDDFLRLLVEKNLPLVAPCNCAATATAAGAANGGDTPDGEQQQHQQHKKPGSGQRLLDTPEVLQQLESVALGGAVAVLEEAAAARLGLATDEASAGALTVNAPLAIAVWRTPASLSVLVSKTECEQLADKVKKAMQRHSQQDKQQEQQQEQLVAAEAEPMVVG